MAEASSLDGKAKPKKGRWLRVFLFALLAVLGLWLFRFHMLGAAGAFLIRTNATCKADAMYVLGGAPFDRGTYASGLLRKGCVHVAYCTGSTISQTYKAEGRMLSEADLSRAAAIRAGSSS